MKTNFRICTKGFVYFYLTSAVCIWVALSISNKNIIAALGNSLILSAVFSIVMTIYLMSALVLFDHKFFIYSNMPTQLQKHSIYKIYIESVAGNSTTSRVKYGGLFLSDGNLIFISQKYAIKPVYIAIPLGEIKKIKSSNVNLLKIFSGGLRNRLNIETVGGESYEFIVWEIKAWQKAISDVIGKG